jgi:hypothetical protein
MERIKWNLRYVASLLLLGFVIGIWMYFYLPFFAMRKYLFYGLIASTVVGVVYWLVSLLAVRRRA